MLQHKLGIILVAIVIVASAAPTAQAQSDNQGFIYGRVVTESGREYTGFLRWGNQEAFWDDLFHSGKEDLPYMDYYKDDKDDKRNRKGKWRYSLFRRWNLWVDGDWTSTRMFIARFGDIKRIEPDGDSEAVVVMRNGQEYKVSGVSDDVTNKIHVRDASVGTMDLHWDRIETIEFMAAPRGADPGVWRLHGTVETREGTFEGFIQWDKQECLNTDILDGDTDEGDVKIPMGQIRSITRRGRRGSDVVLKDGREMYLDGSNDVNRENRGVVVEDPRFGRVTVGWKAFDSVVFSEPGRSGAGYDDYSGHGRLQGTVTSEDGETFSGRIVFDLDEAEGWEMLNGESDDVQYDIPFFRVASIHPIGSRDCRVVLSNGEELEFNDGHDVTKRNGGILVFPSDSDDDPVYLKWGDVDRIDIRG